MRISIESDDDNKVFKQIMVGPSKGKLKKDESDKIAEKLTQPCSDNPNIIGHR